MPNALMRSVRLKKGAGRLLFARDKLAVVESLRPSGRAGPMGVRPVRWNRAPNSQKPPSSVFQCSPLEFRGLRPKVHCVPVSLEINLPREPIRRAACMLSVISDQFVMFRFSLP